jgi:hypothetical protein
LLFVEVLFFFIANPNRLPDFTLLAPFLDEPENTDRSADEDERLVDVVRLDVRRDPWLLDCAFLVSCSRSLRAFLSPTFSLPGSDQLISNIFLGLALAGSDRMTVKVALKVIHKC